MEHFVFPKFFSCRLSWEYYVIPRQAKKNDFLCSVSPLRGGKGLICPFQYFMVSVKMYNSQLCVCVKMSCLLLCTLCTWFFKNTILFLKYLKGIMYCKAGNYNSESFWHISYSWRIFDKCQALFILKQKVIIFVGHNFKFLGPI